MATPPIENLALNTKDVADKAAIEEPQNPAEERTTLFPKIGKFTDFLYQVKQLQPPVEHLHLIGSVKLHGTHADIVFVNNSDEIRLQSRNRLALTPEKDNAGFAAFIAATEKKTLLDLRDRILEIYHSHNRKKDVIGDIVIAGEWCGAGIQKKVAINEIPKFFAIISININDTWQPECGYRDISNESASIFNVSKIGIYSLQMRMSNITAAEELIKDWTDEVEEECPFAKTLSVSGPGEGIVWRLSDYCGDPKFWFKSKGDLFTVSNSSKLPASAVDKDNRERVENFANAIVTENRLEQGWEYLDQKNATGTGAFLKWLSNDCFIEEKREIEALDISKIKLGPAITVIAKPWFWARIEQAGREVKQ